MQAQAYEGYFENGNFYSAGRALQIPERRRVLITVFDEPVVNNENTKIWHEFLSKDKKTDSEPLRENLENIRQKRLSSKGSFKGKVWMSDDFDAPLEEMKEYME